MRRQRQLARSDRLQGNPAESGTLLHQTTTPERTSESGLGPHLDHRCSIGVARAADTLSHAFSPSQRLIVMVLTIPLLGTDHD